MKMFLEIKGEVVFSILIATTVLFLLAAFIIVFVIVYQRRKGAHLNEMAAIKSHFQKVLLETKLEIKEQTLQHIATELHDNLGQIASLIKINLNTLSLEDTKAQNEKLEDTKELTRQLIADVKLLSLSLNSDRIVQVGIGKSLEIEVSRLSKSGYFQASFVQSGEVPVLTPN
ncbi:MAG TPA: histidine kinase, partial [Flavitalea sp.]|nr:histidine kinase [Flavitalea sp.]